MNTKTSIWLAADYHFPGTYSCRVPMSSARSAQAMPAPGPTTVRLALIRNAIELFGPEYTRDELFPVIRSMEVRVRPPERVAISTQLIRGYKASRRKSSRGNGLAEAPVYREFAHANGLMTIYIHIPKKYEQAFRDTLNAIGYWGRADSFACCIGVVQAKPKVGEYAVPFGTLQSNHSAQQFFPCVVSEFRDTEVNWCEAMPTVKTTQPDAIHLNVYIWPMVVIEQHRGGKRLLRRSLNEPIVKDRCGEIAK